MLFFSLWINFTQIWLSVPPKHAVSCLYCPPGLAGWSWKTVCSQRSDPQVDCLLVTASLTIFYTHRPHRMSATHCTLNPYKIIRNLNHNSYSNKNISSKYITVHHQIKTIVQHPDANTLSFPSTFYSTFLTRDMVNDTVKKIIKTWNWNLQEKTWNKMGH